MMMEGKRADISFLVLFRFFQSLFELTVLLETVFLSHLTFFLISLHDTTLLTESLQLAVEHLVLTELTLQ